MLHTAGRGCAQEEGGRARGGEGESADAAPTKHSEQQSKWRWQGRHMGTQRTPVGAAAVVCQGAGHSLLKLPTVTG